MLGMSDGDRMLVEEKDCQSNCDDECCTDSRCMQCKPSRTLRQSVAFAVRFFASGVRVT